MPNLNITNIPAPRVPFIDERTGLMAREWYRFFLNLFVLTGSGNNPITLEELQLGPPNQPDLAELLIQINQNVAPQYEDQSGDFLATLDTAQLMSMMARFENLESAIQGAYLNPPQIPATGGEVVGPSSSTDNAIARFDGTTGKLIQNSVTTIDDTGAATGFTTFAASTSVTTPTVQASNSAGLSLKNASGTAQINMGAGGGDNVSINVSTNLNGTNAQIDISPTGTGHVHIKPSGTGSIEIAPTNVGTINNMTVGATTPATGAFTTVSATGNGTFGTTGVNSFVSIKSTVASGGAGASEVLFGNTTTATAGYLSYSHATNSLLIGANAGTRATISATGLAVTGGFSATTGIDSTTIGATTATTGKFTTIEGTDTTDATSTTAAAVKTAGGLAVVKKIYVGDNIVIATSGKGIDFSATAGTGTSELLADYEEGDWTPTQGAGLVITGAFSSSGTYTKIGRLVMIRGTVAATTISAASVSVIFGGLPFTVSADTPGSFFDGAAAGSGILDVYSTSGLTTTVIGLTTGLFFSAVYMV